jgi:hypothetical protein
MTETQERFLRTVLGVVPIDSVVELHLFPAIRRGTLETGVAVIAAEVPPVPLAVIDADRDAEDDSIDSSPIGDEVAPPETADTPVSPPRLRILTANYRHTIKGVERGKWSVDVQEEADAPLDAVEAVLRGVRHRSTEPADPELVPHSVLAALVAPLSVAPAA